MIKTFKSTQIYLISTILITTFFSSSAIMAEDDTNFMLPLLNEEFDKASAMLKQAEIINQPIKELSSRGTTPLMYCATCEYCTSTVFEFLIQNGAKLDALDNQGRNALHYAAMGLGDPQDEPGIEELDELDYTQSEGEKEFFAKHKADHLYKIKSLLSFKNGNLLDSRDINGDLPIHLLFKRRDKSELHNDVYRFIFQDPSEDVSSLEEERDQEDLKLEKSLMDIKQYGAILVHPDLALIFELFCKSSPNLIHACDSDQITPLELLEKLKKNQLDKHSALSKLVKDFTKTECPGITSSPIILDLLLMESKHHMSILQKTLKNSLSFISWSPRIHHLYTSEVKKQISTLFMIHQLKRGPISMISKDALYLIQHVRASSLTHTMT